MEALIFIALFFIIIWFAESKTPPEPRTPKPKPKPSNTPLEPGVSKPSYTHLEPIVPIQKPRSAPAELAAAELNIYRYNKYQYLISPEWKAKRKQVLKAANYSCQRCKAETDLHVHHISYKNLFRENPEDLVAICSDCHTYIHSTYGYPNTVEEYNNFYGPINVDTKA